MLLYVGGMITVVALGIAFSNRLLPANFVRYTAIGLLVVAFVGYLMAVVHVALLGSKLHGVLSGIVLGLFTFIPVLGLIGLLMLSTKTTILLRENGIDVGFLGADRSQFD